MPDREHEAEGLGLDYSTCEKVLDLEQFRELVEDVGLEAVPYILGEFLIEIRARQEQILAAQERSGTAELKTIAHALKGSSGTMGAKYIYDASKTLEITCVNGTWQDVAHAAEKVSREIVAAESVLEVLAAVE